MNRQLIAAATGLLIAASMAIAPAAVASSLSQGPAASAPLTNLAHLDFLTASVTPPSKPGHTTYQLASSPSVGVLWVYANYLAPGSYQVTGGGSYDAAANTYGQAPTTPMTSPAPPSSTCSTGSNSATSTAARRPTSCCAG